MASTLFPVSRFSDDIPTPPSLNPPFPAPARPSLDSSPMKSRRSFLALFIPARRPTPSDLTPTPGSKLKQVSDPAQNMAVPNASNVKTASHRSRDNQFKVLAKENPEPTRKSSSQLPRSKSRTIMRVISTTLLSRSPEPSSPPPANTSLQAKQNREAALRERGLLPPKPPKDLSQQEADKDRRIPIVPFDCNSVDCSAEPSAAELIRQEWEAKHTTSKLAALPETNQRMQSFRFGAPPSPLLPTALGPTLATQLETVAEINIPLPSLLPDRVTSPSTVPVKDSLWTTQSPRAPAPTEQRLLDSAPPLSASPLPTPPPTPSKPSTSQKSPCISSATTPPSSFNLTRHGDTDSTSNSNSHNRSGSPKSSFSATPSPNPSLSLALPGHVSPYNRSSSTTSATASFHQRRSDSLTQMPSISESSSTMTPSLDNSSRSPTTTFSLSTIDSLGAVSGSSHVGRVKGKNDMLKVKAPEHVHTFPMIMENSVEDVIVTQLAPQRRVPPVSQSLSPTFVVPQQNPVLTRRERGFTEAGRQEKRKIFNPFKRGPSPASNESDREPRRLSVSSSFGNLRRAASSWTRSKSSYDAASMAPSTMSGKAKTFDASHLPPSPTVPRSMTLDATSSTTMGLKPPNRRPIAPTLHSRASIIHEMNAIKDDEVRRMTEVAFLG